MECVGHKVGQRNDDDYLAEQREKDRLFLFIQRFKDSLADVLTVHENESCKILLQGRNGITDQRLIRAENPDQRTRLQKDDAPHDGCVAENHGTHDQHGFSYPGRAAGTVIVAQDRRGSLIHGIDRCFYQLAYAGNDCHDRDVDVASGAGEHMVAADGHQAVCELHDKTGGSQTDNIFRIGYTGGKFIFSKKMNFQF